MTWLTFSTSCSWPWFKTYLWALVWCLKVSEPAYATSHLSVLHVVVLNDYSVVIKVLKTLNSSVLEAKNRFIQQGHHWVHYINEGKHVVKWLWKPVPWIWPSLTSENDIFQHKQCHLRCRNCSNMSCLFTEFNFVKYKGNI